MIAREQYNIMYNLDDIFFGNVKKEERKIDVHSSDVNNNNNDIGAQNNNRLLIIDRVVNNLDNKSDRQIRNEFEEKIRQKKLEQQIEDDKILRDNAQKEVDDQLKKLGGKVSPAKKAVGESKGWRGRGGKAAKGSRKEKYMTGSEIYESKGNYVRQNYKHGYKERVSSKAGYLKSRFLPNGRAKSFYKFKDDNEDDLKNNGDKYEPDLAEYLETEHMNEEDKKVHIKKMNTMNVDLLAEEETSLITKENILMKLMNNGFKLLLLDKVNISKDQLEAYEKKMESMGTCAQLEDEEDPILKQEKKKQVLKEYFGYDDFYDFQKVLLDRLDNGENCMADFYTGAGKSLLFQFHSVVHDGITIVIVPLLSLMIDQVKKIPGTIPAICYNSWVSYSDRAKILKKLKEKKIKVLFVTSEMFITDIVWYLLVYEVRMNLLAIDEAHCASVYSNNFRPSYAMLEDYLQMLQKREFNHPLKDCFEDTKNQYLNESEMKELEGLDDELPNDGGLINPLYASSKDSKTVVKSIIKGQDKLPILCLTATSSQETKKSVMDQFKISPSHYLSSNYYIRDNLFITVSKETSRIKDVMMLLKLKKMKNVKPLLIYCNFKKVVSSVENYLKQSGLNSKPYSGDQTELDRMNILQQFLRTDPHHSNKPDEFLDMHMKIDAIVTTVSLAMGIDHRSIRGVIHYNMPGSLETYIQEIGRAGRDGKIAYCHTFLIEDDYFFQRAKCIVDNFSDRANLRKLIRFVMGVNKEYTKKTQSKARKMNGMQFDDQERGDMMYAYIKNDSIKSKLKMKSKEELIKLLHVLRELLREEYDFNFEYAYDTNSSAMIKIYRSTYLKEFENHKLIKLISNHSRRKPLSYQFNLIYISNILKVRPQYLIVCLKELAQKLQFGFTTMDYSVVFTNMQFKDIKHKSKEINIERLVNRLYERNIGLIRTFTTKVDSFYVLLKSQAKKPISKFEDIDMEVSSSSIMEKYVKLYFERDSNYMIDEMKRDGLIRNLPIIRMREKNKIEKSTGIDIDSCDDREMKEFIAELFRDHSSVE